MSYAEIRKEMMSDFYDEVHAKSLKLATEYGQQLARNKRRSVSAALKKSSAKPKAYEVKTRRRNKWLVICDSDPAGLLITYVCYFQDTKGIRAYMKTTPIEAQTFVTCTGHFFARYRQRLGLPGGDPAKLVRRFFTQNPLGYVSRAGQDIADGVYPIAYPIAEGMGLGFQDQTIGLTTLNTFLSAAEMRPEQKAIRQDIYDELQAGYIGLIEEGGTIPAEIIADIERFLKAYRK